MTAQLRCECGNQLRVTEHHLGRRVQCPGCGKSHLVTSDELTASPSVAGITPTLSAARRTIAQPDRRGKWLLPWLLVLLLVLAAGAATWWFLHRPPSIPEIEGDDLALVPADAQGFGSIRLADLWKTPAMQKAIEKRDDPGARIEQETGLRPEEVERLSGVSVDIENRTGWVIVRTLTPYDVRKVLSRLHGRRQVSYQDNRYHVGTTPDGSTRALYFAGTRVIVAGTETGVKRCLDFVKRGQMMGPLEPVIALAAEGKHTAVAGVMPPERRLTLPLMDEVVGITGIDVTLDVSEQVNVDGKARFRNPDAAKKTQQSIRGRLKLVRLGLVALQFQGGQEAVALGRLLDQVKFTQKGNDILVTAHIDDGRSVVEALLALPRLLGK